MILIQTWTWQGFNVPGFLGSCDASILAMWPCVNMSSCHREHCHHCHHVGTCRHAAVTIGTIGAGTWGTVTWQLYSDDLSWWRGEHKCGQDKSRADYNYCKIRTLLAAEPHYLIWRMTVAEVFSFEYLNEAKQQLKNSYHLSNFV